MWSQILILLASLWGIFILIKQVHLKYSDIRIGLVCSLIFLLSISIVTFLDFPFKTLIGNWMILLASVSTLSSLLMMIRSKRPEIVRYPYLYVFSPVIIVAVFPLIMEMEAIIHLIFIMLQGGAVLGFIFFLVAHYSSIEKKWLAYISGFSFAGAYLVYWVIDGWVGNQFNFLWLWQTLLASGIIFGTLFIPQMVNDSETPSQQLSI